MKEIRIGIIGTGMISERHMRVWEKIPGVAVVAGCDVDEKRLAEWGEKYKIADLYRNYKDLLARDDIDAVDVCVHNNLHMPLSVEVMRAGKHCYCEKPMAGSYADAKFMLDVAQETGQKFAIQLSSIYNLQTRMARQMIRDGKLGKVYHMRSVGERRRGRPGLDFKGGFSTNFYSKEYAGRGALFDMGVYNISQLLFINDLPELESVYGATYQEIPFDERLLEGGHPFGVEELGVGMARFKGGLTMDILESWALNIDRVGDTFVAGSEGGLKITNVDAYGGKRGIDPTSSFGIPAMPELHFYGFRDHIEQDVDLRVEDNSNQEINMDPSIELYNDNQLHWLAYLRGELTDETRYDTPRLALQTMLLSEGICLSQELGRSVTAQEIASMSKSTALRRQETDWGVLEYDC